MSTDSNDVTMRNNNDTGVAEVSPEALLREIEDLRNTEERFHKAPARSLVETVQCTAEVARKTSRALLSAAEAKRMVAEVERTLEDVQQTYCKAIPQVAEVTRLVEAALQEYREHVLPICKQIESAIQELYLNNPILSKSGDSPPTTPPTQNLCPAVWDQARGLWTKGPCLGSLRKLRVSPASPALATSTEPVMTLELEDAQLRAQASDVSLSPESETGDTSK